MILARIFTRIMGTNFLVKKLIPLLASRIVFFIISISKRDKIYANQ